MKRIRALCLLMLATPIWGQTSVPASPPTPASVSPQTTEPVATLKVSTRVVAISAVVKSKGGEPTGGLTKDDFLLKQDGREEPIRYFSQGSELPLTLALLVDTSGSQRTFIGDETRASDVFFETMLGRPQDRAMLIEFDTRVLQLRGLTNSASALHLSLLSLSSRASAVSGTLLDDAVYATAREVLAKETGRKAIVILSDGGDNGSRKSVAEAIEQAQRGDVQIYSILYSAAGGLGTGRPAFIDPGLGILQKLSDSTGGHVFTVSRSLGLREIFAEIAQDLRLEYELGYTPPPDIQPNSYHKLEIKAKDKKLSVQARKGFFAQP
jgi:Ca-activated chloride channel family protein